MNTIDQRIANTTANRTPRPIQPFYKIKHELQPGIIATDMTAGVTEKYDKMIAEGLLLEPRWGQPADIGKAAAMLVRGDLPYAPGQVLRPDGGMLLERL